MYLLLLFNVLPNVNFAFVSWRWRTRTRLTYFSNKLAAPAKTPHHLDSTLIYFIPHDVSLMLSHRFPFSFSLCLSSVISSFPRVGIANVFSVIFICAMVRQLLWWGNKLKKAARGRSSSEYPHQPPCRILGCSEH